MVEPTDGLNYNKIVGTLSSNNLNAEEKKNIAVPALNSLDMNAKKDVAATALNSLDMNAKKDVTATALNSLDMNTKKDVTATALNSLDDASKKDVATRAGISSPNQTTTNTIWLFIVIGFVFVFVVASTFLIIGVTILGKKADDVQVVLTIFTAVIGFLAGLLTPSPAQGTKSS
ncbi:MAG TPA: hypothetical protein VF026_05325 [Ktedonobacteraceae bacterium]